MTFDILLVEDDEDVIRSYKRTAALAKFKGEYTFHVAGDVKRALEMLEEQPVVHAAIIDLSIPWEKNDKSGPSVKAGREVVKSILQTKWLPVIVVSANLEKFELGDIPAYLKEIKKEDKSDIEIFRYLEKNKTFLEAMPVIQEAMNEIASESKIAFGDLWERWSEISPSFLQNKKNEKRTLKSFLMNSIIEKWMRDLPVHPSLFYTHAIDSGKIFTGDILRAKGKFWVVVTPPCDLAGEGKPARLTLLRCENLSSEDENHVKKAIARNKVKGQEKNQGVVKKFLTKPDIARHFIPSWDEKGESYWVSFKNVKTIKHPNLENIQEMKVASISWRFLPNLMQRFGFYVSRMGQDDIDTIEDSSLRYLFGERDGESNLDS